MAATLISNITQLKSIQRQDESGIIVTTLTLISGEVEEYKHNPVKESAWYDAIADAGLKLIGLESLDLQKITQLGPRSIRFLNAVNDRAGCGYTTTCGVIRDSVGTVTYQTPRTSPVIAYLKSNQVVALWPNMTLDSHLVPVSVINARSDNPNVPGNINMGVSFEYGDINRNISRHDYEWNAWTGICMQIGWVA